MQLWQKSAVFLSSILLTTAAWATAHEFWLEPSRFMVPVGTTLSMHMMVGENFTGKPWTGNRSRLTRFVHVSPTTTDDLLARATPPTDTVPTAVAFQQPGTHLVALATNNAFLELKADEFNSYLKEEGLDNVLLLRQQRNELNTPGRESYRRCAKALVQAGPVNTRDTARAFARPVGLALEVVPEQNPYTLRPGSLLTVQVLREGKPLAGALVQVWQRTAAGQPARKSRYYSNQSGRVLFRLSTPGSYLVSTVQMTPTTDHSQANWQSTWATLTFSSTAPGKR